MLQVGLLRIMDIYGRRDAEMSIGGLVHYMEPDVAEETFDKAYRAFLTPVERSVIREAEKVSPLCTLFSNGTYSCMPPSIRYAARWSTLDINGDGTWTIAEALAAEKAMAAKSETGKRMLREFEDLGVTHWILRRPTLIFNNIVNGLKLRASEVELLNRTLYLPPALLQRQSIPKAYFNYWMGDAMMCTRFDRSSCESIVASGLFDAALTKGHIA